MAAVLKTVGRKPRGFESLPLRQVWQPIGSRGRLTVPDTGSARNGAPSATRASPRQGGRIPWVPGAASLTIGDAPAARLRIWSPRLAFGEDGATACQAPLEIVSPARRAALVRVALRGNAVVCACCQQTYRRLLPHHGRPAARCPSCLSLERQRAICLCLRSSLNGVPGARVLHFAPEPSVKALLAERPQLDYVSVDLYSADGMLRMDITQLGFPDDSFDLILCSHVLEHVPDDAIAISEMWRVLKPTGTAVIQVPIHSPSRNI